MPKKNKLYRATFHSSVAIEVLISAPSERVAENWAEVPDQYFSDSVSDDEYLQGINHDGFSVSSVRAVSSVKNIDIDVVLDKDGEEI